MKPSAVSSQVRLIGPNLPKGDYYGLKDCLDYMRRCYQAEDELPDFRLLQYMEIMINERYFQVFCVKTIIHEADSIQHFEFTESRALELLAGQDCFMRAELNTISFWNSDEDYCLIDGEMRIPAGQFIEAWAAFADYYFQFHKDFASYPTASSLGPQNLPTDSSERQDVLVNQVIEEIKRRFGRTVEFDTNQMPGTKADFVDLLSRFSSGRFPAIGEKTLARTFTRCAVKFQRGARRERGKQEWARLFPELY